MPTSVESAIVDAPAVPGLTLLAEIGRGAHTIVYRARRDGRDYAVKVFATPEVATDDIASSITAFRREAAVLACLHHPGLPEIYEVGDVAGRPYLVMELVEGQTLSALISKGRLDSNELASVGIDCATALAVAHRHGLVHRDIKPDNILVTRSGRAKVIDFGLAVRSGTDEDRDAVVGTLLYSPPEQTGMLNRPVDNRSDLYALGAVLYECATGAPPFSVDDVGELIRLHATAVPAPLSGLRPDLDDELVHAIARLLAKDPDDRYGTGDDLAADLARVFDGDAPHAFGVARPDLVLLSNAGSDLPLVGRTEELAALDRAWDAARAGQGSVVLVEGDIGSGKTRLAQELLTTAATAGHATLVGRCTQGLTPLGPLRQALDSHVRFVEGLRGAARDEAIGKLSSLGSKSLTVLASALPGFGELCGAAIEEHASEDSLEFLGTAFAELLVSIGTGGAVLCLEDVQWLDDATRRVVVGLAFELGRTSLLILGTVRRGAEPSDAVEQLCAEVRNAMHARVLLAPLPDHDIAQLVTDRLGGAEIADDFVARLAARCAGNPLAAVEHLRAVLEAGFVRPSWGSCVVDDGALDSLHLSGDVVDIVLRRADALDPTARGVLIAAAAVGDRFQPELLAALCDLPLDTVTQVLLTANGLRLVEPAGEGDFTFVHACLPEALLGEVDGPEQRRLHEHIAAILEARVDGNEATTFALAHHYALGTGAAPELVHAANVRAGRAALASKAVVEAVTFLDRATAAASAAGIGLDKPFLRLCGMAAYEAGRLEDARAHLSAALALADDPIERGEIWQELSAVAYTGYDATSCLEATSQGRAELGVRLPRNKFLLLLTTIALVVAGMVVARVGALSGTISGKGRRRRDCEISLASAEALAHYDAGRPTKMLIVSLRALYAANRLGPCEKYVYLYDSLGLVASVLGKTALAQRLHRTAEVGAKSLDDPRLVGRSIMMQAVGADIEGDVVGGEQRLADVLHEYGRWLTVEMYVLVCYIVGAGLTSRGYTRRGLDWFERAITRLQQAGTPQWEFHGAVWGQMGAQVALGRVGEARVTLDEKLDKLDGHRDRKRVEAILRSTEIQVLTAEGRVGAELDESVAAIDVLGMKPKTTAHHMRGLWASKARARSAQAFAAGDEERPLRLAQFTEALEQFEQAARVPLWRSHYLALAAGRHFLEGAHEEALDRLAEAERTAHPLDAPLVAFEVAAGRGRSLLAMGRTAEAARYIRTARGLAEEMGWLTKSAQFDTEFGVVARSASRGTRAAASVTATGGGSANRHRRHLEALLQVSVAASTVLDPQELARVALDETLGILGAERALLFLCPSPDAPLELYMARDAQRADLAEVDDYSASMVERVRSTREAVVLTGSQDGAAIGSMSVVVHGLRSILVAPVQLEGRLLGVVYLDSRLARGIFTDDDVDILVAITNQVAVSLETARSAQLEVSVEAERRQRALAEMLRDSMAAASATLDPDEVVGRVLGSLSGAVPCDTGVVLLADADAWRVAAVHGPVADGVVVGSRLVRGRNDDLHGTLGSGTPVVVTDSSLEVPVPIVDGFGPAGSWIGVELENRGKTVGVIFLASAEVGGLTSAHGDIVAAFAGQGVVAYENARLFSEVQKLAVCDELTGLDNRRQLFERGEAAMVKVREHRAPLAAVMLDIDHFKLVNDTHGHGVGDDVIREIAARLRSQVRGDDALGRYGGEEFAVVLHGTMATAMDLAERLRGAVASAVVATSGPDLPITVSVGVAAIDDDDHSLADLLNRADGALYEAKRTGRNKVMAS